MPLYPYKCEQCGEDLELVQGMGSDPPDCCGAPMKRVITCAKYWSIQGLPLIRGNSARRISMRNWNPLKGEYKFSTGSHHGQKY